MISNKFFFNTLQEQGIDFFCGVPDSLLKDFCAYLSDHTDQSNHIITSNEGAAVALASGYHLASRKIPLVYMQNSGLGNAVNPLLSLADQEVYGIPMILMIGWRGEPGLEDEPQHRKQGRIQNALLEDMGIPFFILDSNTEHIELFVSEVVQKAKEISAPVAIVVKKGTFEPYTAITGGNSKYNLKREEVIKFILDQLSEDDIVVSTTGKPSREVYEHRVETKFGHQNDLLTVGSMGHCSQIALGIALQSDRNVYCLDGDGSVLMHMGSLAILGCAASSNFRHIVLNNGAHDSVGGQPTVGFEISIPAIAKAVGYEQIFSASSMDELSDMIPLFINKSGPALLEVRIKKGARKDLGRPATIPKENKMDLMNLLNSETTIG